MRDEFGAFLHGARGRTCACANSEPNGDSSPPVPQRTHSPHAPCHTAAPGPHPPSRCRNGAASASEIATSEAACAPAPPPCATIGRTQTSSARSRTSAAARRAATRLTKHWSCERFCLRPRSRPLMSSSRPRAGPRYRRHRPAAASVHRGIFLRYGRRPGGAPLSARAILRSGLFARARVQSYACVGLRDRRARSSLPCPVSAAERAPWCTTRTWSNGTASRRAGSPPVCNVPISAGARPRTGMRGGV